MLVRRWKFTVCTHANLPALDGKSSMSKRDFLKLLGDHPTPLLAEWTCPDYGCRHLWFSGRMTDSNGGFSGGNDIVPPKILKLARADRGAYVRKPD